MCYISPIFKMGADHQSLKMILFLCFLIFIEPINGWNFLKLNIQIIFNILSLRINLTRITLSFLPLFSFWMCSLPLSLPLPFFSSISNSFFFLIWYFSQQPIKYRTMNFDSFDIPVASFNIFSHKSNLEERCTHEGFSVLTKNSIFLSAGSGLCYIRSPVHN